MTSIISYSLTACKAQIGVYVSPQQNLELHVSNDRFVLKHSATGRNSNLYCSDTISYGYWTKVKKYPLIRLYSDSIQRSSLVSLNVIESQQGNEGVKFVINNPIESIIKKYGSGGDDRLIQYSVNVKSDNLTTDCSLYNEKIRKQKFQENQFSIYRNDQCRIVGFEIFIFRSASKVGWPESISSDIIYTLEYEVMNPKSNYYEISIPELTPCYMSAKRLNGTLALVEGNTIEFDGILFKKK
ncbi:MAG: hypothetical protein DI539_29265 [Flavobacterium psychrophilum]|nr:MAG: hypothetical protein DI539_29265 [Flavobacterium psychrophilum]